MLDSRLVGRDVGGGKWGAAMISKRTREQAAMICAIAASSAPVFSYADLAEHLGLRRYGTESKLAMAACRLAVASYWWPEDVDAEAEAMLRTGWSPTPRKRGRR